MDVSQWREIYTSSRLARFLLLVLVACIGVPVYVQAQRPDNAPSSPPVLSQERPEGIPDDVPWPPPIDKLPPVPDSVLKHVPSDVPIPKHEPIVCPPDKHWGPPGKCIDGAPEMGVKEFNGIPYEKAAEIVKQHQEELLAIPGVMRAGLGVDGILLEVLPEHGNIPSAVEGVPVTTKPYDQTPLQLMHHTETQKIRPLHGALGLGNAHSVPDLFCQVKGGGSCNQANAAGRCSPMTRPLRVEFPGAVYHVTARGDGREVLFEEAIGSSGWTCWSTPWSALGGTVMPIA
jgi:hypothetical protein